MSTFQCHFFNLNLKYCFFDFLLVKTEENLCVAYFLAHMKFKKEKLQNQKSTIKCRLLDIYYQFKSTST